MQPIYADHNASTPVDPAVRERLGALLAETGNASSLHVFGQRARLVLDQARTQVASLIGAAPDEIVFTSGGTESNNLAIFGALRASGMAAGRLLTSTIEHRAVQAPAERARELGHRLEHLPVDADGVLDLGRAGAALRQPATLVSVMLVNNELGTVQPVAELAAPAHAAGALLHSDAVQAAGKLPFDVRRLGVDLLSLSAHKVHGPQGVGALYIRRGCRLGALCFGGEQERGLRAGTENVAGIGAFGLACELAGARLEQDALHLTRLREQLEQGLRQIPGCHLHGSSVVRVPNTVSARFDGIDGQAMVVNLDLMGVAISTGAACSAASDEPSPVLLAIGLDEVQARSGVRISLGRDSTSDEVAQIVACCAQSAAELRGVAL